MMSDKKVMCAKIPVSFISGADFTLVPLWVSSDLEYESHMDIDEVITSEIEYRECDDELKEIETNIEYVECDKDYLIDINCLVKRKSPRINAYQLTEQVEMLEKALYLSVMYTAPDNQPFDHKAIIEAWKEDAKQQLANKEGENDDEQDNSNHRNT